MANNTTPTKWNTYNPQQLDRVSFSKFQEAGIDVFSDPLAQSPNRFLQLENVLPSTTGGFSRRWGLSNEADVGAFNIERMFTYTAKQDTTFAGTQDCSSILVADGQTIKVAFSEQAVPLFALPAFPHVVNDNIYAITSRDWFYASNGADRGQKIDYSQTAFNTASNWGIDAPTGVIIDTFVGTGNAFRTPVVTGTDGFGSGATFLPTVTFDPSGNNGMISSIQVTTPGSGYENNFNLTVTDAGGGGLAFGATLTAVVETNTTLGTFGQVVGVMFSGPMILNGGRTYAIAFKNNVTGHVSDFVASINPAKYFLAPTPTNGGAAFTNLGMSQIIANITFDQSTVDPQVDTVLIICTSDGGDLEHLYEVIQEPLVNFTISAGKYNYSLIDRVPDTYSDSYASGPTLLTQNLWVDVDTSGNVIGIAANTPPLPAYNKPILHKNRLFATDGKAVYYSKSLGEVTTSTGLITSKFEEAWPGDNELDIAYGNETIVGLLSDGDVLYIGTNENIYRLFGDSIENFSIPAAVFRGVGVGSQDCWTVVYKDNIPAGYMWTTPDSKIMFSDFNTYNEIGQSIYPIISGMTFTSVKSISYGPYSFAVFAVVSDLEGVFRFFIADTKLGGWYLWTYTQPTLVPFSPSLLSYTQVSGIQRMFIGMPSHEASQYINFFDPKAIVDNAYGTFPEQGIPWVIQTSWQDMGDSTATKVLNELEVWTEDPTIVVSVYSATTPARFLNPIQVAAQGVEIGPLGTYKVYLASRSSKGRYYSYQFQASEDDLDISTNNAIDGFSVEFYPMGRL